MSTALSPRPAATTPRPDARAWWLVALAFLAAAVLFMHGPIPQWPDYHHFADARGWRGLPNAQNVLSNLPFAVVGVWGLLGWRRRQGEPGVPGLPAWRVFAGALACTAVGSSVYHWAPSNDTLLGDRLPIAWACAALTCAFLAERVDTRFGRLPVALGAVVAGTGAVLYWWLTEQAGAGDLRPYLMVQFLPMLLVPAALLMRLPLPESPVAGAAARVVPAAAWWWVLGLYGLAKVAELADAPVYEALSLATSGHVLKHLLAAAAAAVVLRAVTANVTSPGRA